MRHYIDLHTHSTASDGTDSPTEVVSMAAQQGLVAVALTDHDTIGGLAEAQAAGAACGIEVIRGCELSVHSSVGELHLLGLWLPEDVGPLEEVLRLARDERTGRNQQIISKLNGLGVALSYDMVLAEASGKVVGRPHIARALVAGGHVPDERAAFDQFLRFDAPAFVPRVTVKAAEGVRLLADLGATVAVAHPLLVRCSRPALEACLSELCQHGLSALEAYHAEQNATDEYTVTEMAKRLGLGVTGGSDYHGRTKPAVQMGRGKRGSRVGVEVLETLKAQRRERGLPV